MFTYIAIAAVITLAFFIGTIYAAYKLGVASGHEKGLDEAFRIVEDSHRRVMDSYEEYRNA